METTKKKEIIQAWKERHAEMGVIAMTCTATGDSFLGVSKDISRAFNRYTFQLGANLHPNKKLQKLWNQYGSSGFDCSVVKLLDYEDGETNLKRKLDQLLEGCMQSTPVPTSFKPLKGKANMNNSEKFESLKDGLIKNNEAKYGKEIRRKYGDETVNASNARLKGMTEGKMRQAEDLRKQLEEALAEAFAMGDPAGELAHKVCELHRQWLCIYWPEGMYSPEAHTGLADMYVEDERFKANYEKLASGCTEFLRAAIHIYCKQQSG